MLICVEILDFHCLTNTDALVEEDNFVLWSQSLQRVGDLYIDLELNDLTQLSHGNVIGDVESEEKLAEDLLIVNHLSVDRLNNDC